MTTASTAAVPPAGTVKPGHWSSHVYLDIGFTLLVTVTVLVGLTFRDYGITHDEAVQNEYGKMILSYYTSFFADQSCLEYLDLFRYGGFFDLLAAIANRFLTFGVYETRHLLGGLLGVVGLAGAWRCGRLLGGERAGIFALLFLALTPSFYGHMFNNPKDAPFASAMIWAVLFLCHIALEFPSPRRRWVIGFGVALGIAISIRAGAVLLIFYIGLAGLAYLIGLWRHRDFGAVLRDLWRMLAALWPALPIAYVVMALFWPWAYQDWLNPIRALQDFSHLAVNLESMVAGEVVKASQLPPYYLPVYLGVMLPEMILTGLLLAGLLGLLWLGRRKAGERLGTAPLPFLLVGLAALFPVLFFVLARPTAYNGIRHFLFVVPPMAVLAAVACDRVLTLVWEFRHYLGRLLAALLTAAMVAQGWIMAGLHPHQYVYFNRLAGGLKGAAGSYEMDYWSNSLIEAARELADFVERENGDAPVTRSYKVAVCGHALSAYYYFPPYLVFTRKLAEADFMILLTHTNCHRKFEGKQIISIDRFGVALSVVRDRRNLPTKDVGR